MSPFWIFIAELTPGWQFLVLSLIVTVGFCALLLIGEPLAKKYGWQ